MRPEKFIEIMQKNKIQIIDLKHTIKPGFKSLLGSNNKIKVNFTK